MTAREPIAAFHVIEREALLEGFRTGWITCNHRDWPPYESGEGVFVFLLKEEADYYLKTSGYKDPVMVELLLEAPLEEDTSAELDAVEALRRLAPWISEEWMSKVERSAWSSSRFHRGPIRASCIKVSPVTTLSN